MKQTSLPAQLRVLRAERGLTLEEAAKKTGITRETLGFLEKGKRHPHTPTLAKIAEGYGVPVEDLLELEEEPATPLAQAPPPPETSEEGRRCLLVLLRTRCDEMQWMSNRYLPRLESLPQDPPIAELKSGEYQWVGDFIAQCDHIERLLGGSRDFEMVVGGWVDAVERGERVPEDVRNRVLSFQLAHHHLFVDVASVAIDWVLHQRDRVGAAEKIDDVFVGLAPDMLERLAEMKP